MLIAWEKGIDYPMTKIFQKFSNPSKLQLFTIPATEKFFYLFFLHLCDALCFLRCLKLFSQHVLWYLCDFCHPRTVFSVLVNPVADYYVRVRRFTRAPENPRFRIIKEQSDEEFIIRLHQVGQKVRKGLSLGLSSQRRKYKEQISNTYSGALWKQWWLMCIMNEMKWMNEMSIINNIKLYKKYYPRHKHKKYYYLNWTVRGEA